MQAFAVKRFLLAAAAALALYTQGALAAVHTLGFDTLAASTLVELGYGKYDEGAAHFAGFDWGQITVAYRNDPTLHPLAVVGFQHGVASPSNVAYNPGGAASVSLAALSGPFVFVGAKFTAWFDLADFGMPNGIQTLTLEGWNGASLLYQDTKPLSAFSQLEFAGQPIGVDRLVFKTDVKFNGASTRPLQWMMDDFQYSVVPEPGAMVELGAGLLMLVAFGLRRRKQQ